MVLMFRNMIKLTVNPDNQPVTHSFDKTTIIIGAAGSGAADVTLPGEELLDVHVKIQEINGVFYIANQANDPFVTLNSLPFGKKALKECDLLQIGNTTIKIENEPKHAAPLVTPPHDEEFIQTDERLEQILDRKLQAKSSDSFVFTPYDKIEQEIVEEYRQLQDPLESGTPWNEEELINLDIDALVSKAEEERFQHKIELNAPAERNSLERSAASTPLPSPQVAPEEGMHVPLLTPLPKHQKISLKDDYLREYDDTGDKKKSKSTPSLSFKWLNWEVVRWSLSIFLLVTVFVSGLIYLNAKARNSIEEFKAAEGVADVAMALTHAQMHHIKPKNQNWSDPEFLKNNLLAVLAPEYTPAFTLDTHGQFSNNNYFIRIYTSNDLSQFIVLAQPTPSLLQWVVPKATLIVDSKMMEMRKIQDIKALNRLLLSPTNMEGITAGEVSNVIKQGEVIALSELAAKSEKHGFNPPKALALLRPGAQNLVYNAPRYFRFGEAFLQRALMLADNPSDSHEVELLQADMRSLGKYPNIVLYSSLGMQTAVDSQRALNAFLPNNKLLIAYLKFNSKGGVASSHLLMDEGSSELALASKTPLPHTPQKETLSKDSGLTPAGQNGKLGEVEPNHPLYLQLCALKKQLQHPLDAYEEELTTLFENSDRATVIAFFDRMERLLQKGKERYADHPEKLDKTSAALHFISALERFLKKYDTEVEAKNEQAIQALEKLYQEYSALPLAHFIAYIRAAELEDFVKEHIDLEDKDTNPQTKTEISTRLIEELIAQIRKAQSWNELKLRVDDVAGQLKLEKLPDPKKLIAYQSETRQQVVEKLNDFLLSSTKSLPKSEYTENNRMVLAHIMRTAWVVDSDEFEYYINEFELRSQAP